MTRFELGVDLIKVLTAGVFARPIFWQLVLLVGSAIGRLGAWLTIVTLYSLRSASREDN